MSRLAGFSKDIFSDGYKLVGIVAPLLSISWTLAKFFAGPKVMSIQEMSYAWALLPITIWLLIAYVRRWRKSESLRIDRDALQELKNYEDALDSLSVLFDEGNQKILNSYEVADETQYRAWQNTWGKWGCRVQKYLEAHFGLSERNLFRNIVYYDTLEDLGGFCDRHKEERSMLVHQLKTIRKIIVRHSKKVQKWRATNTAA